MTDEITPVVPGTATDTPQDNKGVKTFTQEELDRIISERLKDERKKYADYADLKDKAGKWQQLEESQKTETEKLQSQVQQLQEQSQQADSQRKNALIKAAVVAAAAKAGMADPNDAYAMLDKSKLTIEGETVNGVEVAIADLVKAKPYLLNKQAPNLSAGNPAGSSNSGDLSWHPLNRMKNGSGLFVSNPNKK